MRDSLTAEVFVKNGGTLTHYRDRRGGRITTIAFFVRRGKLYYGSSVFKPGSSRDHWHRKTENNYAILRLLNNPVITDDLEFAPDETHIQTKRAKHIRETLMMKYGTYDIRNSNLDVLQELTDVKRR